MQESTDWRQVVLIIAAGVIGACQIGKVAIAVPLLRDNLGLSLVAISWVAGAYAVLGVAGGTAAGFVVSRFPMRMAIIVGLAMIAAGSLLGATALDGSTLIATRMLEGVGFLAMVIACPTYLRTVVSARDQHVAFACWAAYIPTGAVLMLLAGPSIMQGDWRWLWVFNGALAAAQALAMGAIRPTFPKVITPAIRLTAKDVVEVLRAGAPLLLASAFALYTIQYFALATFLPTFLVDRMGQPLAVAGTLSAAALTANAAANIAAGFFLRLGVPLWAVFALVFTTIGVGGWTIFSPSSPVLLAAVAAAVCFGLTGLLPSSVIASMPRLAPTSQRLALSMGLVQQASSIGQLVGPAILAFWVQWQGWPAVTYLFVLICAGGLTIAFATWGLGIARG